MVPDPYGSQIFAFLTMSELGTKLESKQKELSTAAFSYFVQASKTYPSSDCAQGLQIAVLCKESSHKPQDLLAAIIEDPEKIRKLTDIANKTHASKGMRMTPKTERDLTIIIMDDFVQAQQMMVLDERDLVVILQKQANLQPKELKEVVRKMIQEKSPSKL